MKNSDQDRIRKETERIKKIVSDPEMISGIHNYCDRWCERCTQTRHCSVFRMESDRNPGNPNSDEGNTEFWDDIKLSLEVAIQLLEDSFTELGLDPSDLEEVIQGSEGSNWGEEARKHPAALSARSYSDQGYEWLLEHDEELSEKINTLENLGVTVAVSLKDALEVISFYLFLISVKTTRACLQFYPEELTDDNLGSAKVALIVIDRSAGAWVKILESFPAYEDDIIQLLSLLDITKRKLTEAFPDAPGFKRPGFDDQEADSQPA